MCSQAKTLYVSPNGDDSFHGTRHAPFKTISAASQVAVAGDTVYAFEGVYRERVSPPRGGIEDRPIVYCGEPGKRVVIKGSELWQPQWEHEGEGIYSAAPADSLFDDRGSEYVDHYNPLKVQLSSTPWGRAGKREQERGYDGDPKLTYTCGQVFVDGEPYLEVPFRAELKVGCWFYDAAKESVLVHFGAQGPQGHKVELTTRRRIFAPQIRGLGHINVEGFIFEHCGNQYPTNFWSDKANAQKGAVGTEAGHHWIIRRNVIRHAKTFALDVGRVDTHSDEKSAYDNLVEENYIIDNGSAGVLSCGSRNLVIRGNVILRNNRLRFLGPKRWEQAGIKCHLFVDGLIHKNYIAHNYETYGIWLDNQFPNARVSRNVIHTNGRSGIFLEMSDYKFDRLLIDQNILFDNLENAAYIHDASGASFVNNLFASTRDTTGFGQAIFIRQVQSRAKTYHHSFYGNLLIGNARNVSVNYPAFRSGIQRFDFNLYDVDTDEAAFVVNSDSDKPTPWTHDEFRELIESDLKVEERSSLAVHQPGAAALPLDAWKCFWDTHGQVNDRHSLCATGNYVTYQPAKCELTLSLSVTPPRYRESHRTPRTDKPTPGNSEAGLPWHNLRRGQNKLYIWDGLPIIDAFELPDAEWTCE